MTITQSLGEDSPSVRRRRIVASDFEKLADLLTRGFPERDRSYWERALSRLAAHSPSATEYGYLLESDGRPVGAVLLIASAIPDADGAARRYNISSWYVESGFRNYAPLLVASALRDKEATYLNISPAPHTRPVIEAQGFSCYARGQFYAAPLLAKPRLGARLRQVTAQSADIEGLGSGDFELLRTHAAFGCLSVVCRASEGSSPFVFLPRRVARGFARAAQLVYCRGVDDFVRFAVPLGWFLVTRGFAFVIIDANGPVPGLVGKYYPGKAPRYFRGPRPPRLGDLAYTELPMFGP